MREEASTEGKSTSGAVCARSCLTSVLLICLFGTVDIELAWAEVQINTYTTGSQRNPEIGFESSGDFVIVWDSEGSPGTDSFYSGSSIQAQRYTSDGVRVGSQFQVNEVTTGDQRSPSVGVDTQGNFVVVWHSFPSVGPDTSSLSVQGMRFSSDGSTIGAQFLVNSYTSLAQRSGKIAMEPDGDFVVVWLSNGSGGSDTSEYSVQARLFASDGSPRGDQFQVNNYTTGSQFLSRIGMGASGDFVIVWQTTDAMDRALNTVRARRFLSTGAPIGGEFQVNTQTIRYQPLPKVAVGPAGEFVVIWSTLAFTRTGARAYSIRGRRFAADGAAQGDEFLINSYRSPRSDFASIAYDLESGFVVAWESIGSEGTDTSGGSIQAQRFFSDGSFAGEQFQVNSHTPGGQQVPSMASDAEGKNIVVAWRSDTSPATDRSDQSVHFQHLGWIFVDGFESGDTTGWSISIPP